MTRVSYDSKRLIPIQSFSLNRSFEVGGNGDIIGKTYSVSFTGTLLPDKGSPQSDGTFWEFEDEPDDEIILEEDRVASLLKKQQAIRYLFRKENLGKKFEVVPDSEESLFYFYPINVEIDFPDNILIQRSDFTLTFTTNSIFPDVDGNLGSVESVSENWSIEANEQPESLTQPFTYTVSHSISAKGKKDYDTLGVVIDPITSAKSWVNTRLGINNSIISGSIYNLRNNYNHTFSESIDLFDGSYSVNETWLYASGKVIEDFSINSTKSLDGLTKVNIDGNITGLEERNLDVVLTSKWKNASGYYSSISNSLINRAQSYSQITLNPIPVSENIGRNPYQGTISYSLEYDNRPTNYISGALSESIVVTRGRKSKEFAEVPVIGRAKGPVLQSLGTSTSQKKGLNIEFVLGPSFNPNNLSASFEFPYHLISGLVYALDPINNGATKSFYQQPQDSWDALTGRGSYNIEWTWE